MTPAPKLTLTSNRGSTFLVGRRPGIAGRGVRVKSEELFSHTLLLGTTGSGKTTAATSILTQATDEGWGIIALDLKGDPSVSAQLAGAAADAGVEYRQFSFTQGERCDTWHPLAAGDPAARMSKVVCLSRWTEPYYQSACERFAQLAFVLLERAGVEPSFEALLQLLDNPASTYELLKALRPGERPSIERYLARLLDDRGQLSALAGLAARIGTLTDLGGPLRTTNTSAPLDLQSVSRDGGVVCFSLDSMASAVTAAQIGALALLDIKSMVAHRQATGQIDRPMLVLIDEFSALDADHVLGLFARARSCRVGLMLATQELSDLSRVHEGFANQILGLANTKIVMRQEVPESAETLAQVAGTATERRASEQTTRGLLGTRRTGEGNEREVERFLIHPNTIKRLNTGEAVLIRKNPFRVERVNITALIAQPDHNATRAPMPEPAQLSLLTPTPAA